MNTDNKIIFFVFVIIPLSDVALSDFHDPAKASGQILDGFVSD